MNSFITPFILIILSMFLYSQTISAASLRIEGIKAKKIYKSLVGSAVITDGAAGHIYKVGKSVLCRYTTADMDDKFGYTIPASDPKRYACSIKFNSNGLAKPGKNP